MILRKLLVSLSTLAIAGAASAQFVDPVGDDTDIFLANPTIEATRPNVLFFVDNTANWNTAFSIEKQALINTANNLITDAFNVGMSLFVETGAPNDNIDGAYIRYAVRQMTPTNKAAFVSMINALDIGGDRGNNATYSLAMDEMYRYFGGRQSYSGFGKIKRDYAGNTTYNPLTASLGQNAFTSATSQTYVSPIVSGCQKNFIIFISNGPAGDNSSSLDTARTSLTAFNNNVTPPVIPLTPSGEQSLWSDEYAKFMASTDCAPGVDGVQNVFTYTIDVLPPTSGAGPDHTAMLRSMADNGKGRYFAVNSIADTSELENILRKIFQEVQAVNTVFASVALPVSVNVRGTNLNQVYIGQFRPDAAKGPRWFGNLKMYKVGEDSAGNAFLVDSDGNRAENEATGFVSPNAKSFWTATSGFWNHRPPDENGAGGASDSPDGDLVEKGGAAQRLRTRHATDQTTRQMYTCVSGSGFCNSGSLLSASPFDVSNTNITAADLGTYFKLPVETITSALVGTTPTATATVLLHGFSSGDIVKITGASPSVYNQQGAITVTGPNTFTYVLPSLPSATTARVVTPAGAPHNLVSGDLVEVTLAVPTAYNVAGASITRINATDLEYPMAAGATTSSTGHVVVGKKLVTALSGVGTSARATVPNHGYATGNSVTISGANETPFNRANASITVVDANAFDYTTSSAITGTANTARVRANLHGFSSGTTVTITGSSQSLFNGSFPITKIDDNTFSYAVSGSATAVNNPPDTLVARMGISQITHGSGSTQNIATITTTVPHGFQNGQSVIISNTGGVPPAGYDGTWQVSGGAPAGGIAATFRIGETGTTNNQIRNAPTPLTIAGMLAGRTVQQIEPVVTATGTIRSGKQLSVSSLSSQANATGVMLAGRPFDPLDSDPADRDELIRWVRGRDNAENEKSNVASPDVRPSTHGDVLHSRPSVVNYGRTGSVENDVYIFYGTNDGGLRAVKGGLGAITGDTHPNNDPVQPGDERWTFVPKEVFGKFDRLRTRTPEISSENPRDYFVDGAVSAFTKDLNNDGQLVAAAGDKVYIYFTMRRGGEAIYALEASDPGAPRFLWRKQAGDPGYAEVGQTWSEARVTRVRANTRPSETTSGNPDNLVLVMGAGYDRTVEDVHPCLTDESDGTQVRRKAVGTGVVTFQNVGTCTINNPTGGPTTLTRTKGRGILVIDALDGHVIWQAGPSPTGATHNVVVPEMQYAIPSDVRVADLNGDGIADLAYVGDTGGNVWRLDLTDPDPRNWVIRRLAKLAPQSEGPTDIVNKRKFLFAPEVVVAQDSLGLFFAVLLGSGDREHPFDGLVINKFYMLKDRGEADTRGSFGGNRSHTQLVTNISSGAGGSAVAGGVIREADLFDATSTVGANDSGWVRTLGPGEKIVSSALVVNGTAIFSSNQPTVLAGEVVDACASNLGVARIYQINVADASGGFEIRNGGGYVPSPVFAAINIGGTGVSIVPTSSQGTCSGAACGDQNVAGGLPPGGSPPGPTTGIVCTGTSCWSVGTIDVGSRRRSYWYKEID